jgi:hypothetical protein
MINESNSFRSSVLTVYPNSSTEMAGYFFKGFQVEDYNFKTKIAKTIRVYGSSLIGHWV